MEARTVGIVGQDITLMRQAAFGSFLAVPNKRGYYYAMYVLV